MTSWYFYGWWYVARVNLMLWTRAWKKAQEWKILVTKLIFIKNLQSTDGYFNINVWILSRVLCKLIKWMIVTLIIGNNNLLELLSNILSNVSPDLTWEKRTQWQYGGYALRQLSRRYITIERFAKTFFAKYFCFSVYCKCHDTGGWSL